MGCTHRASADAVGVLAAVPIPAICTPIYGVADEAVTFIPRSTGTGDIHTNLRALCVPGTPPVVLAAHVNHCRDRRISLTKTPCQASRWPVCPASCHISFANRRQSPPAWQCCLLSPLLTTPLPQPLVAHPYLNTSSHRPRSAGYIHRDCCHGRQPGGGTAESRRASGLKTEHTQVRMI